MGQQRRRARSGTRASRPRSARPAWQRNARSGWSGRSRSRYVRGGVVCCDACLFGLKGLGRHSQVDCLPTTDPSNQIYYNHPDHHLHQAEEEARKKDPNRKDVEIESDLRANYYFPTGDHQCILVSVRRAPLVHSGVVDDVSRSLNDVRLSHLNSHAHPPNCSPYFPTYNACSNFRCFYQPASGECMPELQ
jgi:hypothetical protein